MADKTIAQQVADFASVSNYDRLPTEVRESVKMRVLDTLGICIAASQLDTSGFARSYSQRLGGGGAAHAVGIPALMSPHQAAFVNGVLAHSLDYDDTHLPSVLHPSATIVPTALAVAEETGATGQQVIAAIACGLEVCVRAGVAGYDPVTKSSLFFEHGQHATSICGAIGASVTAALLYGFDSEQIVHSLGLAASFGSGIIEANRTGGTVKRLHCGWAAHAAISAAQLVAAGFTGPPTLFEGRFGFFEAWLHGDQARPEAMVEGLGDAWEVPGIFFKPYPANHFTHCAVDAAGRLRERGVNPSDIDSITLGVASATVRTIGEPLAVKQNPETGYMAQFSGPYAVATGLIGGGGLGASLADYTDELTRDPVRKSIMAKVTVVADPLCDQIFPMQFPAVLTASLRDGTVIREEVLANKGGGKNPLSFDDIAKKFATNVEVTGETAMGESLRNAVASLDKLATLRELMEPLGKEI
ncbi:MmgE/PrpD family protein [Ferrimicrobium acidiphilum]|uniref:MmgE/PrpD family protein n=1 Tax=Ferrimicrobium acidiphilum TaxID=121039 RepID=UPI0023F4B4C4|nr:MmgE/PrpD family protein [Ferrimicrobium acidiphilum]